MMGGDEAEGLKESDDGRTRAIHNKETESR